MDFDVQKETERIIEFIRTWFKENGDGCKAVIGISGGKDSSVAAALCVKALGTDRVVGVLMPNGEQFDIDVSKHLVEFLHIEWHEVNIKEMYDAAIHTLSSQLDEIGRQTIINIQPRIRMTMLYAMSQSLNGRVINTCNLSEDWVGYSTLYGDAAGDVSLLNHYCVREVKEIGRYLGLPSEFVDKVPSDGLCGHTDEDNLGFTYAELDAYIRDGVVPSPEHKKRIDTLHKRNLFKCKLMACCMNELPISIVAEQA